MDGIEQIFFYLRTGTRKAFKSLLDPFPSLLQLRIHIVWTLLFLLQRLNVLP